MRQPQFMRSNTFRWALAVAGLLALLVIVLFGFIYWKTDDYLVARSDTAVATQLNFVAGLPKERQLEAIEQDLKSGCPRRSLCRTVRRGWPQDSGQSGTASARAQDE